MPWAEQSLHGRARVDFGELCTRSTYGVPRQRAGSRLEFGTLSTDSGEGSRPSLYISSIPPSLHPSFPCTLQSLTAKPSRTSIMPPSDTRDPFLRIEWTRRLLSRPNIRCLVPPGRQPKPSTGEDTLFAETIKTPRTIRSCISFYTKPDDGVSHIEEVSTLMTLGDGLNGHVGILHGGIVASILDEAMGTLQMANSERTHLLAVGKGYKEGELPDPTATSFTAFLNVTYVSPVRTPGPLVVVAKYVKREGRKEWIEAEIKQREGAGEDDEGVEVVRARGEALMVTPRSGAKL